MIMPVMAMLRGNSSDYTVVAMITDALAFNRFTIISVAAVASGAARTKVYNYREATLWRLLLGVPLCKGLSLLQVVRNVPRGKETRARVPDLSSFRIHGFRRDRTERSYAEKKAVDGIALVRSFFFFFLFFVK